METTAKSTPAEQIPIEHVSLHGHQMSYRRAGEGPVLLLLHGFAGSSRTWIPAMELLQSEFTMLAPDFLGHGKSAKPLGDYSLGNHASSMRDFLHLLGFDRATVVGQSFGGGVALQFAYQYPERCERLVLVDAGGLGREVNWILRLVTLPAAEYVMPVLFPAFVRGWGDSVSRLLGTLGLRERRGGRDMALLPVADRARESSGVRPYHAGRHRPGWTVGECHRPSVSGFTHAHTHRLGCPGQDHPSRPCLQSARGHSQQSVGGDGRRGSLPPRRGAHPLRGGSEGLPPQPPAQHLHTRRATRGAPSGDTNSPASIQGSEKVHHPPRRIVGGT